MGRRAVWETVSLRVGSVPWRNTKEKWVKARKSVETGTEKGTETAGAATGTETGAEETETGTGSTRGSEGTEIGGSAERSATAP